MTYIINVNTLHNGKNKMENGKEGKVVYPRLVLCCLVDFELGPLVCDCPRLILHCLVDFELGYLVLGCLVDFLLVSLV